MVSGVRRQFEKISRLAAICLVLSMVSATAFANCGDSILDDGETCDDGNTAGGDGCSATCEVESGWSCTLPVNSDLSNLVIDPGFEAGSPNPHWLEQSVAFGSPICSAALNCGSAQRNGDYWVWFGGVIIDPEEAMVSQALTIPDTAYELSFWIRVDSCDSPSDYIEVLLDDVTLWTLTGDDPVCGDAVYSEVVLDITPYADNAQHELVFHAETFSINFDSSDFHVDDIFLPRGPQQPIPSMCEEDVIFRDGFE
jgi:cysteine-rich repeat protein